MTKDRVGVFLDRDGTLNVEVDYVRTPAELQLIPGAAEAVRKLNDLGLVTCVISNQSGVARGYLSEKDLATIHTKLRDELGRAGARVDAIYYCPHHPTAGKEPYSIDCDCRKPKPGMLHRAEKELGVNLSRSFVVGDSVVDMQAAALVGAKAVLVLTGYGRSSLALSEGLGLKLDKVAETITEAVEYVEQCIKENTKSI